jgi:hypothetical protein
MKLFTRQADAPDLIPTSTFNAVAQAAHFAAGLASVFGATLLFGKKAEWISFAFVFVLIGVKEAFIDPQVESEIVAGSGIEDWAFWMLGCSVAVCLIRVSVFWLK